LEELRVMLSSKSFVPFEPPQSGEKEAFGLSLLRLPRHPFLGALKWKDEEGAAGALLARRTEEGMEPDDLLCSRNARPEKALVGRAQWKINQPPSLEGEQASLERSIRWMVFGRCAQ
jgi:hypothetical protein